MLKLCLTCTSCTFFFFVFACIFSLLKSTSLPYNEQTDNGSWTLCVSSLGEESVAFAFFPSPQLCSHCSLMYNDIT